MEKPTKMPEEWQDKRKNTIRKWCHRNQGNTVSRRRILPSKKKNERVPHVRFSLFGWVGGVLSYHHSSTWIMWYRYTGTNSTISIGLVHMETNYSPFETNKHEEMSWAFFHRHMINYLSFFDMRISLPFYKLLAPTFAKHTGLNKKN